MAKGTDVRAIRSVLGMTQEELARTMGVSRVTVARWESGERKPSRMAIRFLSCLLESRGRRDGSQEEEN